MTRKTTRKMRRVHPVDVVDEEDEDVAEETQDGGTTEDTTNSTFLNWSLTRPSVSLMVESILPTPSSIRTQNMSLHVP
jgi:hypothetical protein